MELDNPIWWALQGPQRSLGAVANRAARFDPEVSPFGGFEGPPRPADWEDMAGLNGPGATVAVITTEEGLFVPPSGWTVSWTSPGVQMVGGTGRIGRVGAPPGGAPTDPVVPLGVDDVPEMLALVAESRPGPFASRTVEFGGYVGVRRGGRLVAMAGERLRPPGHAEISAVSTLPDHRRQGLAELLLVTVAAAVTARGEVPFLHVAGGNTDAIRLYGALGFTVRRTVWFTVLAAPAD
jgi:ribosomal protein S18 acetylase RimI-like enzyme